MAKAVLFFFGSAQELKKEDDGFFCCAMRVLFCFFRAFYIANKCLHIIWNTNNTHAHRISIK